MKKEYKEPESLCKCRQLEREGSQEGWGGENIKVRQCENQNEEGESVPAYIPETSNMLTLETKLVFFFFLERNLFKFFIYGYICVTIPTRVRSLPGPCNSMQLKVHLDGDRGPVRSQKKRRRGGQKSTTLRNFQSMPGRKGKLRMEIYVKVKIEYQSMDVLECKYGSLNRYISSQINRRDKRTEFGSNVFFYVGTMKTSSDQQNKSQGHLP